MCKILHIYYHKCAGFLQVASNYWFGPHAAVMRFTRAQGLVRTQKHGQRHQIAKSKPEKTCFAAANRWSSTHRVASCSAIGHESP
jgi:hypothetical protein